MIVAVCLNPAVDLSYRLAAPDTVTTSGASHRVTLVGERAGGKATNVVRVLGHLGVRARLIAPLGGPGGAIFATDARAAELDLLQVEGSGPTRRSVAVVDDADATIFNERGPQLSDPTWHELVDALREQLRPRDVVVLAGSVPPGAPDDAYATLVQVAHRRGARVVLDATGAQLRAALPHEPEVVKPNAGEAGEVLQRPVRTLDAVRAAARDLRAAGAGTVLISRGRDGVLALTAGGEWSAYSPIALTGNPTGAGDSLTAVVAAALERSAEVDWPRVLAEGVATSASAVIAPLAGDIDPATRDRLLPVVVVEDLS